MDPCCRRESDEEDRSSANQRVRPSMQPEEWCVRPVRYWEVGDYDEVMPVDHEYPDQTVARHHQ